MVKSSAKKEYQKKINQFISSMKSKVIDMCKKYPIYNEAF